MQNNLATNLRYLCADYPSVASVCRDIGINHQQFAKYLSGRSTPSPNNLRRVCRFFDIDESILLGEPEDLRRHKTHLAKTDADRRRDPLTDVFPGDLQKLRPLLGSYQIFFRAPNDPAKAIINVAFLDERDRMVYSRVIEALGDAKTKTRRWTRCDGKAAHRAGQIFVVDSERGPEASLCLYILNKPHRDKSGLLFGTMSYLASLSGRTPTSSPVVWKKVESYRSVRELFSSCGEVDLNSNRLDLKVRQHLKSALE
ncbi:helix-turn-helix domain-containing protein [Ruegeria arenilitoris]|uniref:helix-turn-helix domain-containing protein n=1 Tax=Ruegeria arenilitoris TaxID=1173585 RepID=UPI00147E68DC|nr:helix-turn-helix transcriptional regulator [Ruegeria arenilitoris]